MLEHCANCGRSILTEADMFVYQSRPSGVYISCGCKERINMTDNLLPGPRWKEFTAKDGLKVTLNMNLAKAKGVSEETLQKIADIHETKYAVLDLMRACEEKESLRALAKQITEIEFSLQDLWGFPLDENFHRPWQLPHCTCPKMDNEERYGTKYTIVNCSCIIHGD